MAKTSNSSKSESVTLRIPNELFDSVLDYASSNTKGNRSEAIVELIEMGLAVAIRQQEAQPHLTVQDIARQNQLSETVNELASEVEQLSHLMQDTVLQRLTKLEAELMGESSASRAENSALRQQQGQSPDLDAVRDRILSELKLGRQAPGYKAAAKALDRFINELMKQFPKLQ
jgi:metal-responsive CopG/Arc/MetJ family transcriptional regulator